MVCKNCNNIITDTKDYCDACGAKVIRNRLTIRNLFNHISEEYFDYDNKFFKTFIHLFTKPEAVIGGYIDGTRKKYINAINYFAIAVSATGLQLFVINNFFPELADPETYNNIFGVSGNGTKEFQVDVQNKTGEFIQEYQSVITMLSIPFYALMSKLVFFNIKKYNYTEHLVIFMYMQAQSSIFSAIILITSAIISNNAFIILSFFTIPITMGYNAFCFKRLYRLSIGRIILKTLIFILILGVIFVLFGIISGIVLYSTGELDKMIKAAQQQKTSGG